MDICNCDGSKIINDNKWRLYEYPEAIKTMLGKKKWYQMIYNRKCHSLIMINCANGDDIDDRDLRRKK